MRKKEKENDKDADSELDCIGGAGVLAGAAFHTIIGANDKYNIVFEFQHLGGAGVHAGAAADTVVFGYSRWHDKSS